MPKIEIIYSNPPEVPSPVTIRRWVGGHKYEREIRPDDLIGTTEAVKILKITLRHLYRLVEDRKLKAIRKAAKIYFKLHEVEKLAKERGTWPSGKGPWLTGTNKSRAKPD